MKAHGELNLEIAKERADWDKNYLKLKILYKEMLNGKEKV
jgi:uncharacterized coiled-coil protein SlyX